MKIQDKIKKMAEKAKGSGGPSAESELGAEAEVIVRDKDGNIKQKIKANKTDITL